MANQHRYIYLNYQQQETYYTCCRHVRAVCSRRFGKTHGILTPFMYRAQKSMPRGGGIFLGASRKQLLTRTVPAVLMAMKALFGLEEGKHFVFGKPPAKLNYPDPVYKPKEWSATLNFANGFCWYLASLAVPGSCNGWTTNALVADECKTLSKEKIDNEAMPTLSGIVHPYADPSFSDANPFYKSTCFVSDASLSSKGNWLEREEVKMDAVIEHGPNKGKTGRQLQEELIAYAHRIMDFNDACYWAKKKGRKVMVVSQDQMDYVRQLEDMCQKREGKFKILAKGGNTLENCQKLVDYGVLSQDDANLLYSADFMISEPDYLYAQMVQKSAKYQEHIKQLRRDCFFFFRSSSLANLNILGLDYIRQMKRDLPPLTFAISILGLKMDRFATDGYYFAFDTEQHTYIDHEDNGVIDDNIRTKQVSREYNGSTYTTEVETIDYERLTEISDCRMDGDLHADDDLCIAFDWNARINWLICGVVRHDFETARQTLYVLNSLYVKLPDGIETLVKNFNRYYAPHRRRHPRLFVYYDATAKQGKAYASELSMDFITIVLRLLEQAGWDIVPIDMGSPMSHNVKYKELNRAFQGYEAPSIMINQEKNEELIFALQVTGAKQGFSEREGKVVKKDKSAEKLAYNPDLDDGLGVTMERGAGTKSNTPEELRSDSTDAFDSLYLGVKHFRYGGGEVFACF